MLPHRSVGIIAGALILILGCVIFFMPALSTTFLTIFTGVVILVVSVSSIIAWIARYRKEGAGVAVLVLAIVGAVVGVVCLLHPLAMAQAFIWIIALCIIVLAVAQLISAFFLPSFLLSIISIIAAAVTFIIGVCSLFWPMLVVSFVGAAFIVEGLMQLLLGIAAPSGRTETVKVEEAPKPPANSSDED
ncbi:MAG: DUF308 domain-containing protein [Coriobacteriaceae bacterium]|nr:DUF308 domain-containing protein [Coriobacteriaceae bacterium]